MEKEVIKLYMNDMTRQKIYDLFGVERVDYIQDLEDWLQQDIELTDEEILVVKTFQKRLIKSIDDWNEHELSLGFIGPIINLIDFRVRYKLNFFAQRPLSATIGDYEMIGKPDGIIATGGSDPKLPYFSFHEFKRDVNSSGDPAGQNLAAMLVGQELNEGDEPIYGCFVVGRHWHFMILKGNEFTISKSYAADDDEIFDILKILKTLKSILFKRINYTPKEN